MNCTTGQAKRQGAAQRGFTLVEVVFAMAIAAVMFLALYSGLTGGFAIMKLARENTRATQIMVEKMETIRLYTFDQIRDTNFMPGTFTTTYYPIGGTNCGTVYTGTVTVGAAPVNTSYQDDMRKVTVTLKWKTGQLPRARMISTYVSRYGLQNYVYF